MSEKERYLTAAEKEKELAFWEEDKARCTQEGEGGKGYADHAMISFCAQLNALEGVCTLQSCAGHREEDSEGPEYNGQLWLALDERLTRTFFEHGIKLATASNDIDHVAIVFKSYGKIIIDICFFGDNKGRLKESMAVILAFFQRLAEECMELRDETVEKTMEEVREYLKTAPNGVDYDDIICALKIDIGTIITACDRLRTEGFLE